MNTTGLPFERFLNARWAAGATFRQDCGRVAFRTDITGVAQIWTLDQAMAWPSQLTFDDDRIVSAAYSPTDNVIAFERDSGGDENNLVFVVDDSGGLPRRLSVADAKHMFGGWSPDGSQLAWVHNGRNGRDFDVYVYDLASGQERCVHQSEGYWYVMDWLPGGDGLLLSRADSNEHCELHLLVFDETIRQITPDDYAFFNHAAIHPDGSGAFVSTNWESDFMRVMWLDFATGVLEPILEPEWDVEELAISDDGAFLSIGINEDGFTRLLVRDNKSGDCRNIAVEAGVMSGVHFMPGEHRLAFALTTPTSSHDVYTVSLDGRLERWTESSMAGIPAASLATPELVHYPSFDGLQIPGLLYRPKGEQFSVVIDIHGGPEAQRRPAFSPVTQYLLNQGIAVFSPNVRGSRGYGKRYMGLDNVRLRMNSVKDIQFAHEFLVGQGAHPDRIALMGGSYGGFMVLSALVTYPDLWAAGVDIVGIANFVTFLENTSEYRRALRAVEYGSLEEDRDFLESISPANHMDKIAAPLMVIHGRNDPRVPVSEAELVVQAAAQNGVEVECIIYEDEGHGLAKRRNRLDAYPRIAAFLKGHIT